MVLNCLQVFQHKEKISDISSQASNEATLEQMLQKVRKVPPPGLKATSLAVFLTEHDNAIAALSLYLWWFKFSFDVKIVRGKSDAAFRLGQETLQRSFRI